MRRHIYNKKTTINQTGLCTSWEELECKPVISTIWHPVGCFQTAVLPVPFSNEIYGYMLTTTIEEAQKMHLWVVDEIATKGIEECLSYKFEEFDPWNPSVEASELVVLRSEQPNGPLDKLFNERYINLSLRAIGFPSAVSERQQFRFYLILVGGILFIILLVAFLIYVE